MNEPGSNEITPPEQNVVARIVEIFDVEDFNSFLMLASQVEEPEELLEFIDEPEDVELFSDSLDDSDFADFVLDLVGIDGTNISVQETKTFADVRGTIRGTKWNDLNGNGIKDDNEPGLAGWTIYLDENENGQLDDGETFVITDAEGNYLFEDLEAPGTYVVAEVPKSSDVVTFPSEENVSLVNNDSSNSELSAYTGTPNDPLFADQWHLQNTGQTGGTPGADANVIPAWEVATGEDVTIAIVDDGLQSDHPDLVDKYLPELSYDFVEDDSDPSPNLEAESPRSHGTSVAGVAAASTNNNIGVAGAAPDAHLAGIRLFPSESDATLAVADEKFVSDSQVANALSYQNQEIDIYNNSWQFPTFASMGEETQAALQNGVRNGRGGLGNIFVFGATNGRPYTNINYNAYSNSRYTIAVAAIDHTDNLAYYSTPGASILVSAYSGGGTIYPSITTTDLVGENGFNPESDYRDGFGGTSSAAPLVSGVVALMLDANPNLTWRDVQHIIVETSAQNDPTDPSWTLNGAGHEVSYKYGFGAVDANAAVTAAQDWTTVEPEIATTSEEINVDTAIPDNDGEGVTSTVGITEDVQIEWVEVVFDAEHTQRGDLEVTLTSPDGTESILAETNRDVNDDYDSWVFTSARHWDESSLGDWTLEVSDNTTGETGTWNDWQLNIYGTDPNANDIIGAQQVTVGYGENVDNINFGAQQVAVDDENTNIVAETSANEPLISSDVQDRFLSSDNYLDTITDYTIGEDLSELPDYLGFEPL